jgi:hypothetical protein
MQNIDLYSANSILTKYCLPKLKYITHSSLFELSSLALRVDGWKDTYKIYTKTRLLVCMCFFISLIFNTGIEYWRAGCVIGRWTAIDVVRSTTCNTECCRAGSAICRWAAIEVVLSTTCNTECLQSGVRHRSLSSNWCRPLYDAQYWVLQSGIRHRSLRSNWCRPLYDA